MELSIDIRIGTEQSGDDRRTQKTPMAKLGRQMFRLYLAAVEEIDSDKGLTGWPGRIVLVVGAGGAGGAGDGQ